MSNADEYLFVVSLCRAVFPPDSAHQTHLDAMEALLTGHTTGVNPLDIPLADYLSTLSAAVELLPRNEDRKTYVLLIARLSLQLPHLIWQYRLRQMDGD